MTTVNVKKECKNCCTKFISHSNNGKFCCIECRKYFNPKIKKPEYIGNVEDLKGEIWKEIDGQNGRYLISNMNRVKATYRTIILKNGKQRVLPERILSCSHNCHGYKIISFWNNNKNKCYSLHRLIAKAFIPNPENKKEVNHLNGDKKDNRLENLEWATHQENLSHAFRTGLVNVSKGDNHYLAKLNSAQVKKIRELIKDGESAINISKMFCVSPRAIRDIRNNISWKHVV